MVFFFFLLSSTNILVDVTRYGTGINCLKQLSRQQTLPIPLKNKSKGKKKAEGQAS